MEHISKRQAPKAILVVEDDPIMRLDAVTLLEDAGYSVVGFGRADQALSYLQGHAEEVAMVFTDILLPGQLNGVDLARTSALAWPWLTVVVTSSEATSALLPEWTTFLPKPWRPADILRAAGQARSVRATAPDEIVRAAP